jgi:hypothetical protein
MRFPQKLDVLTEHATLIGETGGTGGLRDEALLESALVAVHHHYEAADVVFSRLRRASLVAKRSNNGYLFGSFASI